MNKEGESCALGSLLLGAGVEPEDILEKEMPNERQKLLLREHYGICKSIIGTIPELNDDAQDIEERIDSVRTLLLEKFKKEERFLKAKQALKNEKRLVSGTD